MKTPLRFPALVLLSLGLFACSEAKSPVQPGPAYLGRWSAQLQGAPCPYDVELLANGTARMNFLNDDSPEQLCTHHELSFSVGAPAPDAMIFAVQQQPVRQCWFAAAGSFLDLACDEHGFPARGTVPIRFSRVQPTPAAPADASIVGDWADGGTRFSFGPNGSAVVGGRAIGYRILNSNELELLWPTPERCNYQFRGQNELLLQCTSMSLQLQR